mmetsp:Transcript_5623/g.5138  ORF Transcript_5623/g.5138 Transcript_5623/m.5138 type:complete len:100 (+) Transcript_5623:22-321(+)
MGEVRQELRDQQRSRNPRSDVAYMTELEQNSVANKYQRNLLCEAMIIVFIIAMIIGFSDQVAECKTPLVYFVSLGCLYDMCNFVHKTLVIVVYLNVTIK